MWVGMQVCSLRVGSQTRVGVGPWCSLMKQGTFPLSLGFLICESGWYSPNEIVLSSQLGDPKRSRWHGSVLGEHPLPPSVAGCQQTSDSWMSPPPAMSSSLHLPPLPLPPFLSPWMLWSKATLFPVLVLALLTCTDSTHHTVSSVSLPSVPHPTGSPPSLGHCAVLPPWQSRTTNNKHRFLTPTSSLVATSLLPSQWKVPERPDLLLVPTSTTPPSVPTLGPVL